jgi:mannose-1-phosphate guanylyltransferase
LLGPVVAFHISPPGGSVSDEYLQVNMATDSVYSPVRQVAGARGKMVNSAKTSFIGAEAESAETEYGWIEPGQVLQTQGKPVCRVNRFFKHAGGR